jgi:autotransporter translocation and assembly factor TamB
MVPLYKGSFRASRADVGEQALMPPAPDTGGVELPPGVVAPPEESGADVVLPAPAGPAAPAAFLAEIRVQGDRNLWVETPEMDCELAGDITFRATEEAMGIAGTVHTLRGTYAVLNTRFDVTRAEVEFVDPADPGASIIDAEATTTVLEENVTATVTGTVLAPQIHMTTESGMSEAEIYELLALRIKRGEGTSPTEQQGVIGKAFRDSYLAAFTNRFGGELGREIGLDTFAYEEGEAGTRPSVTVGKNVGRDFFFKYKQAVGSQQDAAAIDPSVTRESLESPERALTVEYRLNQMFLLQGETGTLPQGDDYLNVDLRAEWGY